ncbi:MAG: hypothetical protein Q4G64_05955 [bacterium]|nr:hypothetical protein [bacterium]
MRSFLRALVGILATALALAFGVTGPASATSDGESTLTVAEYAAYLAVEAPDVLPEFEALTPAEQEQFLDLLANPSLYTEEAQSLDGVDVGGVSTTQALALGGGTNGVGPLATTVDRGVWSNRWVSALGVRVLEYKTELGYRVTSGKVTRINYSSAYVVRNLNPLVQTGEITRSAWVSSGGASARMSAKFNYNIGPLKGLSVQIGTLNASLTGFPNGRASYFWWGE